VKFGAPGAFRQTIAIEGGEEKALAWTIWTLRLRSGLAPRSGWTLRL